MRTGVKPSRSIPSQTHPHKDINLDETRCIQLDAILNQSPLERVKASPAAAARRPHLPAPCAPLAAHPPDRRSSLHRAMLTDLRTADRSCRWARPTTTRRAPSGSCSTRRGTAGGACERARRRPTVDRVRSHVKEKRPPPQRLRLCCLRRRAALRRRLGTLVERVHEAAARVGALEVQDEEERARRRPRLQRDANAVHADRHRAHRRSSSVSTPAALRSGGMSCTSMWWSRRVHAAASQHVSGGAPPPRGRPESASTWRPGPRVSTSAPASRPSTGAAAPSSSTSASTQRTCVRKWSISSETTFRSGRASSERVDD